MTQKRTKKDLKALAREEAVYFCQDFDVWCFRDAEIAHLVETVGKKLKEEGYAQKNAAEIYTAELLKEARRIDPELKLSL